MSRELSLSLSLPLSLSLSLSLSLVFLTFLHVAVHKLHIPPLPQV